jgi:NADH-quinone oxidoreductase subunit E
VLNEPCQHSWGGCAFRDDRFASQQQGVAVSDVSRVMPAPGEARDPTIRFDEQTSLRLDEILERHPTSKSALLPVLWTCQQRWGWLSPGVIRAVAERLRLSPASVVGVASFYTMFHLEPPAEYVVELCRSVSCHLCRSRELYEHLRARLGIGFGESTDDGRFSMLEVQCQGLCDQAPVVRINDDRHLRQTPESIDRVLDRLP